MAKGGSNSAGAIGQMNADQAASETAMLNQLANYARPEMVMPQTEDIRALSKTLSPLAEYQNRAFEREFNPGTESARIIQDRQVGDLAKAIETGTLTTAESNALKKGAVRDLMSSGVKLGKGFNAGGNITASIYGDKSSNYINQLKQLLRSYLAANQRQQAGVAPQDLISLELGRRSGNLTRGDAFKQQLAQMGMQQMSNIGNRGMSGLQAAIQEAAQNRAASNQLTGGLIGTGLSVAGTLGAAAL